MINKILKILHTEYQLFDYTNCRKICQYQKLNVFLHILKHNDIMSLLGFKEECGLNVLKREYVERILSDIMRSHGYERITLPVIEPFSSYSEDVVGKSPWPEWNEKCIFRFNIIDYSNNYESSDCKANEVCLIPEGTVSITRWLASIIEGGGRSQRKLFYSLNCYRNELITSLSVNKSREFQQFGVELLDFTGVESDIELIEIVTTLLQALGINKRAIKIRINDVALFNKLVVLCGIGQDDIMLLKKHLDYLAECHAGKHAEDYSCTQRKIWALLSKYKMEEMYSKIWNSIVDHAYSSIDDVVCLYPDTFRQDLEPLLKVFSHFSGSGVTMELDLSVIRSHQYYSGLSFEVDVVMNQNKYIEIAGGGRYDRLVGTFLKSNNNTSKMQIPCTGFAFGVDRVISMMNDMGLFSGTKEISSIFNFK